MDLARFRECPMKPSKILGVGCIGAVLIPLLFVNGQVEKRKSDEGKLGGTEGNRVSIANGSIYTTSTEDGFKKQLVALFHSENDKPVFPPVFPYSYDLKIINQRSRTMGASNIFVVRGEEIEH